MGKLSKKFYALLVVCISPLVFWSSCKDDLDFKTAITLMNESNFIVLDMFEEKSGNIFCNGIISGSDSAVVLEYNSKRQIVRSYNLSEESRFQGKLKLKYQENIGWIISRAFIQNERSIVDLYVTDRDFNVLQQNRIYDATALNNTYSGIVNQILPLKNGEIVVSLDYSIRIQGTSAQYNYKQKLIKFDQDLQIVYEFDSQKYTHSSATWLPLEIHACETSSGDVFFSSTVSTERGQQFAYGLISSPGILVYQKVIPTEFAWFRILNNTLWGNFVVVNRRANNEGILIYNLIDPLSGETIQVRNLPKKYGLFNPESPDNTMSVIPDIGLGQIVQDWEEVNLHFLYYDLDLNYESAFTLALPEYAWYNSYRQISLANGNILLGISIDDRGSKNFILQEVNTKGEMLN